MSFSLPFHDTIYLAGCVNLLINIDCMHVEKNERQLNQFVVAGVECANLGMFERSCMHT